MTTPDPNAPQQPPAQDGPAAQPPAQPGQAPVGQPAQPPVQPGPPAENPGKTMGIVGLVLGFLGPLSLVGLILSIVGLRKSKKAGYSNGVAIAGIIVSSLTLVAVVIGSIVLGLSLAHVVQTCNELGPGTHFVNGVTYTCS